MRKEKEANILECAERVWVIVDGTADERMDLTIAKTDEFFIQTGMKVRLSDDSVGQDVIDTKSYMFFVRQSPFGRLLFIFFRHG
ncbi:MAG: hypothetical protein WBG43_01410 [Marinifilaceae bacterium]